MIDGKVLSRSFSYNGLKLPDPDPRMTPEEVKNICSNQYPELATAAITGAPIMAAEVLPEHTLIHWQERQN